MIIIEGRSKINDVESDRICNLYPKRTSSLLSGSLGCDSINGSDAGIAGGGRAGFTIAMPNDKMQYDRP